jgi:hypothetical protein
VSAARRLLAVAAITFVVVVVLRSYTFDDARVCREQAASDNGIVEVCGPVGLEDVPTLGVMLLVGVLLLLPDMSEVGIPGLVTLKRAIEEQSKQTASLSREVAALTMRQDTTVNIYGPAKLDDALADVAARDKDIEERGKAAVVETAAESTASETGVAPPSPARAVLEAEVTRLWNALDPLVPGRKRGPVIFPLDVQLDWYGLYQKDVEAFRTLRNTVVHEPGYVTDEEVRKGVELGRSLLASYRKFIAT